MRRYSAAVVVAAIVAVTWVAWADAPAAATAPAATQYVMDPAHSSVTFRIEHVGISWVAGRFDDVAGACTIDKDDANQCSFEMTIKTASVDTNNAQRDAHLRTDAFFDANQFPEMTFKSTRALEIIKAGGITNAIDGRVPDLSWYGGYEVTGDLTLHGVTRPVTFSLYGGKEAEFPKGKQRVGFFTDFEIKRSDFGMKPMAGVGDHVKITISFEAVAK